MSKIMAGKYLYFVYFPAWAFSMTAPHVAETTT